MGRRASKQVLNSGDWSGGDCTTTYHYFYDGHSIIEERNGEGDTIRQYVWGTQYIDELVQIGINDDPTDGDEQNCETFYWAVQDANYNVMGIVDSSGDLKERYEYTPYGQRTVFKSAGSADLLCMSPVLESQPVQVSSVDQPYGICDFGHQGLLFDKEWGWYRNGARERTPVLARFPQRDPSGYFDSRNLYGLLLQSALNWLDPYGTEVVGKNKYGEWQAIMAKQAQTPNDPGPYGMVMHITFKPDKKEVCCKEIAFVQVSLWRDMSTNTKMGGRNPERANRETDFGWGVDRILGRNLPWYGYGNDGMPEIQANPTHGGVVNQKVIFGRCPDRYRAAEMTDTPHHNWVTSLMLFESLTICKDDVHAGHVSTFYGGVEWGFNVSAKGEVSLFKPTLLDGPTAAAKEAIRLWNQQAAGAIGPKNAAGQQPLNAPWINP